MHVLLTMFLPVLMLAAVFLAIPQLSQSLTGSVSGDCNGRGQRYGNNSEACVCDTPYNGTQCERCADGFYGDQAGANVCYLPCSGEKRLLYNFTSAGIGEPTSWTLTRRPLIGDLPYCLWVVAPLINRTNYSPRNNQSFYYTSVNSYIFNPPVTDLRISLKFRSNQVSQCYDETVLVYAGFPETLNPFSTSLTPSALNTSGSLIGAFTGDQLLNESLSVTSTVLTVVYYPSTTPSAILRGFNLTVSVDSQPEGNPNVTDPASGDQANVSSLDTSNSQGLIYLSTLLSSSNSPLSLGNLDGINTTDTALSLEQSCLGRRHHSTVYDPCSNSLWIYGGIDRLGELCDGLAIVNLSLALNNSNNVSTSDAVESERVVRLVWGSDASPRQRFFHAAALLPCQQSSNGSQMLVFGGFTSRLVSSRELWMYSEETEEWRRMESAPTGFSLAGHTATLTPDKRLVVIGGVTGDLAISPATLIYHLVNNSWEVLPSRTLDVPGVYGHSAVYDSITDSVLVYGGYMYSRPHAVVSSSLYSLHLASLTWRMVKLAHEVPSRMFHSMVVVGNLLVIYGGLLSQQDQPGLEGVCPSNDVTLIDLAVDCNGRPTLTLAVNDSSPRVSEHWGHTLVTDEEYVFIVGGQIVPNDNLISLLHLPPQLSCSLARSITDCQAIPGCSPCTNSSLAGELIACFNISGSNISDSNTTSRCSNLGGDLVSTENSLSLCESSPFSCEQFDSCSGCLSTDLALEMGCVWCSCQERCYSLSSSSSCSCGSSHNSTQLDICFLDRCAIPSCTDCQSKRDCRWLSRQIRDNPAVPLGILVNDNAMEFGCYSEIIHSVIINQLRFDASVQFCPVPCSSATSCGSCVISSSPAGGPPTCVWAEYSQECMSSDLIPLACSLGNCGPILSSVDKCPSLCAARMTCQLCLMDPSCVWLNNLENGAPRCVDTRDLSSGDVNQLDNEVVVYNDCPIGVSCYRYCHGNSLRCVVSGTFEDNTELEMELLEWVDQEPEEEEVECLDCGGFSSSSRCQSCLPGYFNPNPGGETVSCRECACNDHDVDDCDPNSGLCSCQNHTRSVPCEGSICLTLSQCSLCEPNYSGNPRDGGQCYLSVPLNFVANFSLSANQTTSFFFGPGPDGYFFSNVDVRAGFVLSRGLLDVYVSTDSSDVSVTLNRDTWTHQLRFRDNVPIISKTPSSLLSGSLGRSRRSGTSIDSLTGSVTGQELDRQTRALQHSSISSALDFGIYHYIVDERLTLIVPHEQEGFSSNDFFITVFAREHAEFDFYYRQDLPRLNLFVFFSIFLCFFLLASMFIIFVYRLGLFFVVRRRRRREKERRERRANRPLVKVVVYLGEKKQSTSTKKKKDKKALEFVPQTSEKTSIDTTRVFVSSGDVSKEVEKEQDRRTVNTCSGEEERGGEIADLACTRGKTTAGVIELETHKKGVEFSKGSSDRHKKKKKYLILSPDDIKQWPVGIEPTADEAVCLSTILVLLPSSKNDSRRGIGGQLCTGSTLLDYPKATLEEKRREKGRKGIRFRRKNRLVPATNVPSANTTQL